MNPFDLDLDKTKLYNIGKGKAAAESTEMFLLNLKEIGKTAKDKFVKECLEDPNRFE